MWDNTRPMKGISAIHIVNEQSFTALLMFAQGRRQLFPLGSRHVPVVCVLGLALFPTATLEGL
jgi:hypothetical protein